MNLDKANGFDPIRPERQADVKQAQNTPIRSAPRTIAESKDRVAVSGKAAEVGRLVTQMKDLSGLRAEKVAELRDQIGAGRFDPAADRIAEAIMKDELF